MIAYDGSGHSLVLADGAELLVHDGPSEGPRWRRELGSPLIAVGATPRSVVAVEQGGRVTWFEPDRDAEQATLEAGAQVRAAAVSPEGHVLAATSTGARVLTPRGPGATLEWPGASAVAWAPDGRMLVADDGGRIGEFSADGRLLHEARVDGGAVAAAHNAQGFWIVATARKLVRLVGAELHHLTSAPEEMPVRALACAADGASLAIALGDDLALVMSWPARDTIGQLRYFERKVAGLSFGPAPFLAVALDGGDGNKLNMRTGDLHRTDTQPGRPHRRWMVQKSVSTPAEADLPAPPPRAAAPAAPERAAFSPPAEAAKPAAPGVGTILAVLAVTLAVIGLIAAVAL